MISPSPANKRARDEFDDRSVGSDSPTKKARSDFSEATAWVSARSQVRARNGKLIKVSMDALEVTKGHVDRLGVVFRPTAPKSGKTSFPEAMETYLRRAGGRVITINLGSVECKDGSDEEVKEFFKEKSGMSSEDVLSYRGTPRLYVLIEEAQNIFKLCGSRSGFWMAFQHIRQEKNVGVLLFCKYHDPSPKMLPRTTKPNSESYQGFPRLTREDTRSLIQKRLPTRITDWHQHEVLFHISSGYPKLISLIIEDAKNSWAADRFKTPESFARYIVSPDLRELADQLLPMQTTYGEEAKDFLKKMLLEYDPITKIYRRQDYCYIWRNAEIIRSLMSCGAICKVEGGVQFSAAILRITLGRSLLPGPDKPIMPRNYTFNELLETCLRRLQPTQLARFLELGTDRARRELVASVYGIAASLVEGFCAVVPFVGSTVGAPGYSLDIHFDGSVNWAMDFTHGDIKETPPHIRGFLKGGLNVSPVEQWTILVLSHGSPDQSKMMDHHWYIHCTWDCTSAVVRRKDCKDFFLTFG